MSHIVEPALVWSPTKPRRGPAWTGDRAVSLLRNPAPGRACALVLHLCASFQRSRQQAVTMQAALSSKVAIASGVQSAKASQRAARAAVVVRASAEVSRASPGGGAHPGRPSASLTQKEPT